MKVKEKISADTIKAGTITGRTIKWGEVKWDELSAEQNKELKIALDGLQEAIAKEIKQTERKLRYIKLLEIASLLSLFTIGVVLLYILSKH